MTPFTALIGLILIAGGPVHSGLRPPQDEVWHRDSRNEAWTVYAFLENPSRQRIGATVTFFEGRWFIFTGGAVMAAFVHEGEKAASFSHEIFLPVIGDIVHAPGRLDERFGAQRIASDKGAIRLFIDRDGNRLSLVMTPIKPWFPTGGKGGGYVYPRLSARGTLVMAGKKEDVSGRALLTHVWGDAVEEGEDSFLVQLEDGTDLDINVYHDPRGAALQEGRRAVISRPDGGVEALQGFGFTVLSWWTSPKSRRRYPAGWEISMPGQGPVLTLSPTVPDQELRAMGIAYWLGTCTVTAAYQGQEIEGRAYAVLLGHPKSR